MSGFFQAIRNLLGNSPKVTLGVGLLIVIFGVLGWVVMHKRASSAPAAISRTHPCAELDLRGGMQFGHKQTGAVLGFDVYQPLSPSLNVFAGTLLWGKTRDLPNNWDWHAGVQTCRWRFCASFGASYMQRTSALIGSHANYILELSYLFNWWHFKSIDGSHRSDAGTTPVNVGLNAALVSVRLQ